MISAMIELHRETSCKMCIPIGYLAWAAMDWRQDRPIPAGRESSREFMEELNYTFQSAFQTIANTILGAAWRQECPFWREPIDRTSLARFGSRGRDSPGFR